MSFLDQSFCTADNSLQPPTLLPTFTRHPKAKLVLLVWPSRTLATAPTASFNLSAACLVSVVQSCLKPPLTRFAGPYKTGVTTDAGADTADGFTVAQIEENPSAFCTFSPLCLMLVLISTCLPVADNHVAAALAGAVRGQLSE